MEAPPDLLMTLLPYQKEFLAWAVKQERGDIKGGILADEMGMGKTIQARLPLPLVMLNYYVMAAFKSKRDSDVSWFCIGICEATNWVWR